MTSAIESKADSFDPHDPELVADPYPTFAEMRSRCPVSRSEQYGGFWAVTGHQAMYEVTHDADTFVSGQGVTLPSFGNPRPLIPLELDGEIHRHYRRILSPLFSPRSVAKLEPAIHEIADDLIDAFIERGEADLVTDFSRVLPAAVLAHMMGVGQEVVPRFTDWAFRIIEANPANPEAASFAAIGELYAYFSQLIDELRADVRNTQGSVEFTDDEQNMLKILLRSTIDDEPLAREDIVDTLFLNVLGGADTTNSVIGTTLLYLSRNAEAREKLASDPGAIDLAMDEFLRVETPIQGLARTASRDMELAGQNLKAGDKVLLCYGAANRDPAVYDDPDALILDRGDTRHFAFGSGKHRCLGTHVARLQYRIAIQQILTRLPDFHVTPGQDVTWAQGTTRSLHHFPVSFTPGPRVKA